MHGSGVILQFGRGGDYKRAQRRLYRSNPPSIKKGHPKVAFSACCDVAIDSEAEVRERLVGFGHTVHVFTFLNRATFALYGVDQLTSETLGH